MKISPQSQSVGDLLRDWRKRRRMSQLDLAVEAEISTRHLSFIETGRSQPSREMIMHLSEQMEIPLRERNVLLTAAGYAPVFPERSFDDPQIGNIRKTIDLILTAHEPNPALVIDRRWNLISSNNAVKQLLVGIDQSLLTPPINVLRLSLHPLGLAPKIINLPEWRNHLFARLRRDIDLSADPFLIELMNELRSYKIPNTSDNEHTDMPETIIPIKLATEVGTRHFISTTMVFGTPLDVTLSELAIECFFPVDL